jgi:hypothetical protein
MLYEFQVEADTIDELQTALIAILSGLKLARAPGVVSFRQGPSPFAQHGKILPFPNQGLEAQAQGLGAYEEAEEAEEQQQEQQRRRRGRPRKANGAEPIQDPAGNVVAVTQAMASLETLAKELEVAPTPAPVEAAAPVVEQEAPAAPSAPTNPANPFEGMKPVPEDTPDMSTEDMRARAIALMQQAFAYAQGPDLVRAVHRRLKVRKIQEVPDERCRELLDDATAVLAQLKATSEPLDLLAMQAQMDRGKGKSAS